MVITLADLSPAPGLVGRPDGAGWALLRMAWFPLFLVVLAGLLWRPRL